MTETFILLCSSVQNITNTCLPRFTPRHTHFYNASSRLCVWRLTIFVVPDQRSLEAFAQAYRRVVSDMRPCFHNYRAAPVGIIDQVAGILACLPNHFSFVPKQSF